MIEAVEEAEEGWDRARAPNRSHTWRNRATGPPSADRVRPIQFFEIHGCGRRTNATHDRDKAQRVAVKRELRRSRKDDGADEAPLGTVETWHRPAAA